MGELISPVSTARVNAALRRTGIAVGPANHGRWQRVAAQLADPVGRFDELADLAARTEACDKEAGRRLDLMIGVLADLTAGWELEVFESGSTDPAELDAVSVDATQLRAFAAGLVRIASRNGLSRALDAPLALLPLVAAAQVADRFIRAVDTDGPESGMRLLSGQMPDMGEDLGALISGLGGRDDLLGVRFPDPEFPHLDFPDIDLPGDNPVDEWIKDIWKRPPDHEEWEYVPWWWKIPGPDWIDPAYSELIRCMATVRQLMNERAAIPPPPLPTNLPLGLVWADPIVSLSPGPHCPEATLTIYGGELDLLRDVAVVLVPTTEGCRPVPVPRRNWRPTQIKVYLPPNVTSCSVHTGWARGRLVTCRRARCGSVR